MPSENDEASVPVSAPRVGLFGGTFDPVHIGHLILAEEARFQLQLDRVYFIPASDPPHKRHRILSAAHHRVRMLELAISDIDYLCVSHIDIDRPGPHYSADMVRLMQAHLGASTEIFFLMGMDSLRDLLTWHEAEWLVENCRLAALSRPDVKVRWDALEARLPNIRQRVQLLDMPKLEIASHLLQERVRSGRPIRHQVPRSVELYIQEHDLYQNVAVNL